MIISDIHLEELQEKKTSGDVYSAKHFKQWLEIVLIIL